MWSLMKDIAREMGVRTDVPFRELTAEEREIVFHGPVVKKNIIYQNKTSGAAGDMDFTYFNATYTVENAPSKVKDEKGMKRVEKFLKQGVPDWPVPGRDGGYPCQGPSLRRDEIISGKWRMKESCHCETGCSCV